MIGKVAPEIENPVPVSVAALMANGVIPVEASVSVCVAAVLTATSPNARLVALELSMAVGGFRRRANDFETLFALAVKVTACDAVTEAAVAINAALVAWAGTIIVAGKPTAELPLERFTLTPPLGAAALRVTVQESVSAPVIDALEQVRALKADDAPAVAVLLTKGTLPPQPERATVSPLREIAANRLTRPCAHALGAAPPHTRRCLENNRRSLKRI